MSRNAWTSIPNMHVDIAARIGELGRQPRAARKFFDRYQDRIVFGTDASASTSTPQQTFGDALYEIYYRFLETEDEYFDYAPAPFHLKGAGAFTAWGCRRTYFARCTAIMHPGYWVSPLETESPEPRGLRVMARSPAGFEA